MQGVKFKSKEDKDKHGLRRRRQKIFHFGVRKLGLQGGRREEKRRRREEKKRKRRRNPGLEIDISWLGTSPLFGNLVWNFGM